jgi:hypothetical protein
LKREELNQILQREVIVKMEGNLEGVIIGLNNLEGGNKEVDIIFPTEMDAKELKECLTNYNVKIKPSMVPNWYVSTVSKKENK